MTSHVHMSPVSQHVKMESDTLRYINIVYNVIHTYSDLHRSVTHGRVASCALSTDAARRTRPRGARWPKPLPGILRALHQGLCQKKAAGLREMRSTIRACIRAYKANVESSIDGTSGGNRGTGVQAKVLFLGKLRNLPKPYSESQSLRLQIWAPDLSPYPLLSCMCRAYKTWALIGITPTCPADSGSAFSAAFCLLLRLTGRSRRRCCIRRRRLWFRVLAISE